MTWTEGMEKMIQINPREIAAEALMEIMTEEAYNNMTLRRLLRQNGAMPRQDRAFVTEVVNGTLRNLIYIDHVLNTFSKTKRALSSSRACIFGYDKCGEIFKIH